MRRKIILYTNCSKGGVTSVIRNRALAEPDTEFTAIFLNDRDGSSSFADLENVNVRLVRRDRAISYLKYLLESFTFDSISILSEPEIANAVSNFSSAPVEYEFHSSDTTVIERELQTLNLKSLDALIVPSAFLRDKVSSLISQQSRVSIVVEPNLVDTATFSESFTDRLASFAHFDPGNIVLWIGRFDKGKGYKQFLRILGALPPSFHGVAVVSLEADPSRAAEFFYEADCNNVSNRVTLFSNLSSRDMATLFGMAKNSNGVLLSTSLMESFGYAVAEAISVGTPVVAYDLPALRELEDPNGLVHFVPIGSFQDAVDAITSATSVPS